MKQTRRDGTFLDLPNVGKEIARDFETIGLRMPADLRDRDPYELYVTLCMKTHSHHDPCVLDTFMSAVDYMNGNPAKPWWAFTKERKEKYGQASTA